MTQALAGIKVLDISNVLAGPFCAYQLGLLGAEIIKVEVPGVGDLARMLGADSSLNADLMGASFLAQNGASGPSPSTQIAARQAVLERLATAPTWSCRTFVPAS